MESFVQRHREDVIGVLSGFDRMLFRGTLRSISYGDGLDRFVGAAGVRYKDFKFFAEDLSEHLKKHAQAMAQAQGRPFVYLSDSRQSKEQVASEIARRDGVKRGLVCVLRCVEPCMSFSIRRDEHGTWRFVAQERKCLHLYFYYLRIRIDACAAGDLAAVWYPGLSEWPGVPGAADEACRDRL